MLARLDELEGVRESRVDWTGRYVLLALEAGADESAVVARAAKVLGEGARRLDESREAEQLGAFRSGEPWLRTDETLKLSEEEARVVGARLGEGAAAAAGLDAEDARLFAEVVQDELRMAFGRLHADGPDAAPDPAEEQALRLGRVKTRSLAFLTEVEAERACQALLEAFTGRG
ncbi:MAG: hypothetical protein ACREID_02130 [Planctomycetota bacterium]